MKPDLAPRHPPRRAAFIIFSLAITCLSSASTYCFTAHDTPRMGLADALAALETDLHPQHRDAMVAVVRDRVVQGIQALHAAGGEHAQAALAQIAKAVTR